MQLTKLAFIVVFTFLCTVVHANYRADINRDGVVNFADVADFTSCFLQNTLTTPSCASEDINQDGTVNYVDFSILSAFFLEVRPDLNPPNRLPYAASSTSNFSISYVMDLDSDGDKDIFGQQVVFTEDAVYASTGALLNDGELNFEVTGADGYPYETDPHAMFEPQDFGADGSFELIRKNLLNRVIKVYSRLPGEEYEISPIRLPDCSVSTRVRDVNHDGLSDVICWVTSVGVSIHFGDDDDYRGVPDIVLDSNAFDLNNVVSEIEVLDINADGWEDVLVATYQGDLTRGSEPGMGGIKVYLSNQAGGFIEPTEYFLDIPRVRDILIADLNGDGIEDFTLYSDEPNSRQVHMYLLGSAAPAALPVSTYSELGVENEMSGLMVAVDSDGDGAKELVVQDVDDSQLAVLRFFDVDVEQGLQALFHIPRYPLSAEIRTGYFNDDDIEDLAGGGGKHGMVFLKSEYPNSYKAAEGYKNTGEAADVVSLHLSNDAFIDLAVAYTNDNMVGTRINTTGKPGQTESLYPVGNEPTRLLVADLNSDGQQDVVAITDDQLSVSVLVADGSGGFCRSKST